MIFMFGLIWPIRQLRSIPHRLDRGAVNLYFWATVRRRRAAGEDEWKEMDMEYFGRRPPEGHPWWEANTVRALTPEDIVQIHEIAQDTAEDKEPTHAPGAK